MSLTVVMWPTVIFGSLMLGVAVAAVLGPLAGVIVATLVFVAALREL